MADTSRYLLGVDAGNTVVKAVLFDTNGNQLAVSKRTTRSLLPVPGHVERDPVELWHDTSFVIRDCILRAGVPAASIAGVGCAGHGNGLYLLDRSGAALAAVQSLDSRAIALADALRAGENAGRLHDICGQEPWPSQTPTLLAWFRVHEPELFERIGTAFFCKDYVNYLLTGERSADLSDATGAGLVRILAGSYDDELLRLYGLDGAGDLLPPLSCPTGVVGHVTVRAASDTGLTEGTPVVAGLFDVVACALGSGAADEGQASIIAGTWSINQVVTRVPVRDRRVFMMSIFGPDRFMAIESSATSAGNLEWYVREMHGGNVNHEEALAACNRQALEVRPHRDDPFFHPFLYGSRFGATMRAGFYGLAGWHGEGHLVRALFEGVAFEHRRHVGVLKHAGVRFDRAVLSGGGARSTVWPQMFADVLEVEIATAGCDETGALGAAIAAGVGAGLFRDLDDGVTAMTRPSATFTPNRSLGAQYSDRYQTYLALVEALQPVWQRLAQSRSERPA